MKHAPEYKKIVPKLLIGHISTKERILLNETPEMEYAIYNAWQSASEENLDKETEERILNAILRIIHKKKDKNASRAQRMNRYLLVASIALFLVTGALSLVLFFKSEKQMNWYVVNTGRQSMDSLVLEDGTRVILNAGSRLTYPQEFTGKERVVSLSGQAFFQVAPDKEHPFIVRTKQIDITALGTAFEIFSYDIDKKVEAILVNGKIRVNYDKKKNNSLSTILYPNEMLTYEGGKVVVESVDANSYSSWRLKGELNFRNEKLSMILPRLEKWYGHKIECPPQIANYYRFTFTVRNEPLDLIIKYMLHSEPSLNCRLSDKDIYIWTKK